MAETSALEPDGGHGFVRIDWDPPEKQLRQFGFLSVVAFPFLTWMWTRSFGTAFVVAAVVGLMFAVAAAYHPKSLRWIFIGLCAVFWPIGVVVGEVLFGLVFFLVITPVALWFKIIGRDALKLKIDRQAETYWEPRKQASGPESYFRQS
jgi:cell division protein FtsW (lipid II flippase)